MDLLPFHAMPLGPSPSVELASEIPKELDIFYRTEVAFLPEGKTFEQLTPVEQKLLRDRYRFDPMKVGIYQGITGFANMV